MLCVLVAGQKAVFYSHCGPYIILNSSRLPGGEYSDIAEGNATAFHHVPVVMIIKIILNFATPVHST